MRGLDQAGAARRRTIRAGIRGTEAVEILDGLAADARVISPWPEDLADGAPVKVTGRTVNGAAAARSE